MQSNYNRALLFVLLMMALMNVTAQIDYEERDFRTDDQATIIPDSLSNEDAVIVLKDIEIAMMSDVFIRTSVKRYSFFYFYSSYNITMHKRVKIQTQYGLDAFSRISFIKHAGQEMTKFIARVIKPDGVIEIDSSDVYTENHNHSKFFSSAIVKLAIPGLEIGDEFEYLVVLKSNGYPGAEALYFHDDYPVMESMISFISENEGLCDFAAFNGELEPTIGSRGSLKVYNFTMSGLKGIKGKDYAILQNELPYLSFIPSMNFGKYGSKNYLTLEEKRLKAIRERVLDGFSYEYKDGKAFSKKEIFKLPCLNEQMTNFEKLYALHDEINKKMLFESLSYSEKDQPVGYFFRVWRIDNPNLIYTYVTLFNILEIDYDFILARERYNGQLFMDALTIGQFDDVFFRFTNENDEDAYLFPKSPSGYFEINEIPPDLIGAEAMFIPRNRKIAEKLIVINYNESVSHFENRQVKTTIHGTQDKLTFYVNHSFGGSKFSEHKSEYSLALDGFCDEDSSDDTGIGWLDGLEDVELNNISIDSISATYMRVNYAAESNTGIVQLEEDLFSLPVKQIIQHYTIPTHPEKRVLDYYPISVFVQKINIFILFDSKVKMMNEADFDVSYTSPVCEYLIRAAQINDSTIYLQSEYELKKSHISAKDYSFLRDMNIAAEQAGRLNLVYSIVGD